MSEFTLIEASNGAETESGRSCLLRRGNEFAGVATSCCGRSCRNGDSRKRPAFDQSREQDGQPDRTHSSAAVRNNVLEITGEIVSDSKDAADIIAQGKAGADWQLSIGADVKECELVKGSREVNGQEVEGPFYHIKKSTLREVSVVAVGADAHTNMKVNAKFNLVNQEGEAMNNKSETKSVSAVSAPNDAVPSGEKAGTGTEARQSGKQARRTGKETR